MAGDQSTGGGGLSGPFAIETLHALIDLMKQNHLTEIQLRDGDKEVRLVRSPLVSGPAAVPNPALAPAAEARSVPTLPDQAEAKSKAVAIVSPMVGTFYAGPSPEAEPYVSTGTRVEPDTVVCLIEAMKVFNEIRAEMEGTIVEVLVENGTQVEYGQPLFLVEPA